MRPAHGRGETNGAPFGGYRDVRKERRGGPFPHDQCTTRRTPWVIAIVLGGIFATPYIVSSLPSNGNATIPDAPAVPDVPASPPTYGAFGPVVMDISGNLRYYMRDTTHASETACTFNKVATTTQGSAPVNQVTLTPPDDACWYADATTGTTIPAGDWESLIDVATTSGNVDTYLYPNGGGTYANGWDSQNAGCGATTHWQCVDEVWPPDDATSYVIATTTTGDKESNALIALVINFGFTDIDVTIEYRCAAASGAAGGDSFMLLVTGAEEYTGALNDCTGTWATHTDFRETSPSGNEWTALDIDALECGYISGLDLNPDAYVSACRARIQITYPTVEYDVYLATWDKPTNLVKTALGSCLNVVTTGDDVQCLVASVAQQVLDADDVVRVRVAHSSSAGTVVIDYDDADPTGDSRITVPIPEFENAAAAVGGAFVVLALHRRRGRRTEASVW